MIQHGSKKIIAELVDAAGLQAEVRHHRLALEWGQMLLTRMVQLWDYIEAYEAMAYEDKVVAQVHVLDEATGSLWQLHKTLAHARRVLRQHRRQLRHQRSSIDLSPTSSSRLSKSGAKTRSPSRRRRLQPIGVRKSPARRLGATDGTIKED